MDATAEGLRKLFPAMALILVLLCTLVTGAALIDHDDRADAASFCARTPLGQTWPQVERRIVASNADQSRSGLHTAPDGGQSVGVTFNGLMTLSRHVCTIAFDAGSVRAKRTLLPD